MIQESQKIHTYVLSSTIYNSQDMEANQMSINRTDEWINKIIHTHTHTHSGILLSHKKNEILPFAAT